ncbi:hypothetical protein [Vibrio phage vB_VpaM_XM1]
MGWSNCGTDSKGRPIGYAFSAICDHDECNKEIDRGLSYACGGMHGETEVGCEKYFCSDHKDNAVDDGDHIVHVCESCAKSLCESDEWKLDEDEGLIVETSKLMHLDDLIVD